MMQKKRLRFGSVFWLAGLLITVSIPLSGQDANNLNSLSSEQQRKMRQEENRQVYGWKEDPPKGTPGLFRNRFFTGGGIGFQFGNYTAVELAPTAGFIVHKMFRFGITANFSYFRDNYFQPPYSDYFWGGSFFIRFYPIRYLFLHAEIGGMNQPYGLDKHRKWLLYPMAGLGYNQPLGNRVALNLKILWNFNQSEYSIYGNPIISIGCDVGL